MRRDIVNFNQDDVGDWVAELSCGHAQHVRHNPPWIERPWVTSDEGRKAKLGESLDCGKCEKQNKTID